MPTRTPPQNRDADRALLGGVLRDPDVLPDVLAVVRPETFCFDAHWRILAAIADLAGRDAPVDLVSLHDELRRRRHLEDIGGVMYLTELWEAVPTGANAKYHAKLVREAALLRGLIHSANEVLRDAYDRTGSAEELLGQAEQKLFALGAEAIADAEPRSARELIEESLQLFDARYAAGGALSGLETGFADLDANLCGLDGGELIVLGARPSIGKTGLALNIADRVVRAGSGVAVLQPGDAAGRRSVTGSWQMRSKAADGSDRPPVEGISEAHVRAICAAATEIRALPFYLEDTPDQSAARILAVSRRQIRRHGVKLVVVDYLGLMKPEDARENRTNQIGILAKRMKNMARSLGVPVLLLAQLNREVEHANRKPRLADLRDSGEIEQHADRVLFLHRDPNLSIPRSCRYGRRWRSSSAEEPERADR